MKSNVHIQFTMNNLFKIKTFLSNDRQYLFCNCCFISNEHVIGDYKQIALAETMELSLTDLADKLANYKPIKCSCSEISYVFKNISDNIYNSCLPICVEPFDGYFGFFCEINDVEYLIVKELDTAEYTRIKISKREYLDCVNKAMRQFKL